MSRTDAVRSGDRSTPDRRTFDLHGVVVAYEDGPDRCTIYPRYMGPTERLCSWITADADAFLELEAMR